MKTIINTIIVLAGVMFISGCIVASLNPLYTDKDLVSDPALVGTWSGDEKESFTFVEDGKNRYECTITSDSIANNFEARLVQLGKYRFIDLYPKELDEKQNAMNPYYRLHMISVHSFSKIKFENDQLYVSMLNMDWMNKQLEQKKINIPYHETDGIIVLTGPTKQLQKFVLKYADDTSAFEIYTKVMKRIK